MNPITSALKVLTLTRSTRDYLRERDPKALEQADAALADEPGYNEAVERIDPRPPKITVRARVIQSNGFAYLEQLCWLKGIVCERRGRRVEMTTPDGGTTADCDTVAEAFDTLRNDPAFCQLPRLSTRALR